MPRSSPAPDRLAVEAQLSADELRVLAQWCVLLGVPRRSWHHVPPLAVPFATVAAVRLIDELRVQVGATLERATLIACQQLGIEPEAYRSRCRRWALASIGSDAGCVNVQVALGRRTAAR